jgi:hypothetical protein
MISLRVNVILVALIFVIFLLMDKEARYFFKRRFQRGGIDFASIEPESRGLNLKKIDYNGEYFTHKKEAVLFNFDPLLNPSNMFEQQYNEMLNYSGYWAGNKRPIVFGSEAISFVSNPHLNINVERAKDYENQRDVMQLLGILESLLKKPTITKVSFYQLFHPDNIREYLNSGSTPTKGMRLFEKGELSGRLSMTRKQDLSKIIKWVVPLGVLFLILLLWSQGVFDNILPSF